MVNQIVDSVKLRMDIPHLSDVLRRQHRRWWLEKLHSSPLNRKFGPPYLCESSRRYHLVAFSWSTRSANVSPRVSTTTSVSAASKGRSARVPGGSVPKIRAPGSTAEISRSAV